MCLEAVSKPGTSAPRLIRLAGECPVAMESERLTSAQVKAVYAKPRPMQHYIAQLKLRMEVCQFPADDPMMVGVERVHQAMMDLTRFVHGLANGETVSEAGSEAATISEDKGQLPAWRANYGKYPEDQSDSAPD